MLAAARNKPIGKLSPREREVIANRVLGHSFKEVARNLCISVHTAKNHAKRAYAKLGVHSALEAAVRFRG